MKKKIIVFILFLAFIFSYWFYNVITAPEATAKQATLRVTKNATEYGVIQNLFEKGYIKNKLAFKILLRITKDNTTTEKDNVIRTGFNTIDQEATYTISKSMNAWDMAYILLNRGRFFDGSNGAPDGVIWEGENTFKPVGLLSGKIIISSATKEDYFKLQLMLKGENLTQYPRLNFNGEFELEVPEGKYMLTITPCNYANCKTELPREITIEENKTTSLELKLD
jgi:cell division protein YceG involved in septum cleavage